MDRGAWPAAVQGVAKGLMWLKWLSTQETHRKWAAVWLGIHWWAVRWGSWACRLWAVIEEGPPLPWLWQPSLPYLHRASSLTPATWSLQCPCKGGRVVIPSDRWRSQGTSLNHTASTWQISIPNPALSRSKATSSLSHCSLVLGPRRAAWGSDLLNWVCRHSALVRWRACVWI